MQLTIGGKHRRPKNPIRYYIASSVSVTSILVRRYTASMMSSTARNVQRNGLHSLKKKQPRNSVMANNRPYNNRHVIGTCKDCTDRQLGCHDHCERYKKAQREKIELNRKINKKRGQESALTNYFFNSVKRMKNTHKSNFKDKT